MERFLLIVGTNENKVVLVAHADTYFDATYGNEKQQHLVIEENGLFISHNANGVKIGLGADDRAGCAILWLLLESGHSILITDGEEHGRLGSTWLMEHNPDIADLINSHQFIIQFDRRNSTDYKCYNVGTDEFRKFIQEKTGFSEPNRSSYTDICTICRDICGVNFSIGYYDEHSGDERINISEWHNTLRISQKLLGNALPKFKR